MKSKKIELWKIFEFIVVWVVIPAVLFALLGARSPEALKICYYVVVALFISQATLAYVTSAAAIASKAIPEPDRMNPNPAAAPRTTFFVCAYLPNEVDVLEATIMNILQNVKRPAGGLEVILAYNTPEMMPLERRLRELAALWPELVLSNAHGSRSKSENLNYALGLASGEIIAMLDADHLVAGDCIEKAWRWLETGVDVVQGRCSISNAGKTTLSSLIQVEFEGIYGVSHHAKSRLFRTALFGGSDAYWKASVLKKIGFAVDMLTEDIDCTLRTLIAGHHIIHDRSIVSREQAPEDLHTFWYQRKRWSQGWFQVSVKYQWAILTASALTFPQKFIWTWLLLWRVTYDCLSNMLFPILFAYWYLQGAIVLPMNYYIWFGLVYTMLSGPFEGLVAYKNAVEPRFPFHRVLLYGLLAFPYTLFKNMIQMIAIRDELAGKKDWVVSPRS